MTTTKLPRVLMFCGQFWPRIGGAERQALGLSRALMRRGCQVEVLTPQLDNSWPLRDEIEGININRFPFVDLTKRLRGVRGLGLLNTLVMGMQVRQAVGRHINQFDILHAHIAWPMVAYAGKAAQVRHKKIICKVAAGGRAFDLDTLRQTSPLGSTLARSLLVMVDAWIAISKEIRSNIEKELSQTSRIVSIPNGVEIPSRLELPGRNVARRFLYLGRLARTAYKDYKTLLRAFNELAGQFQDCQLKIVGGGELESEVLDFLHSLPHARSRTELVGFSDPVPWLQWADVLIHPSMAEGMSNTLLEGMAHGLVCIANDIPPNREVLGEGEAGILVPVGDTNALVQVMRRLATGPGECTQWRERGRNRVEKVYAMDRITDDYLRLYANLLNQVSYLG